MDKKTANMYNCESAPDSYPIFGGSDVSEMAGKDEHIFFTTFAVLCLKGAYQRVMDQPKSQNLPGIANGPFFDCRFTQDEALSMLSVILSLHGFINYAVKHV